MKTLEQRAELEMILNLVSQSTGVSVEELKSRKRNKTIVFARRIYLYFARESTQFSYASISSYLNRDHATAIHQIREHHNAMDVNAKSGPDREYLDMYADFLDYLGKDTVADRLKAEREARKAEIEERRKERCLNTRRERYTDKNRITNNKPCNKRVCNSFRPQGVYMG